MKPSNEQIRQLKEKHYRLEAEYARQIMVSPKNSPERTRLYQEGYNLITQLIAEYQPGGGETNYTDVVAALVAKRVSKGGAVFDLGCASGNLLCALALRGFRVAGMDVSDELVRQAREKLSALSLSGQVVCADVMSYAHPAPVDCVVMDNVIEHFHPDSIDDILKKCHVMLKPGGYLLVLTPHRLSGPHDVSGEFLPLGSVAQGFHLKEFSFTDLNDAMGRAGFGTVMGFPFHPRLLRKIGWIPDCSAWAGRKALILEKFVASSQILAGLFRLNKTASHLGVALCFPSICMAQK